MRKAYILLLSILTLVPLMANEACSDALISEIAGDLEGFNYLRDYKVMMKKVKKNKLAPKASYSIILNKGMVYRFLVNEADELPGDMKFELYSAQEGLMATNYNGDKDTYYGGVEFNCKLTAAYTVSMSFSEGQEGCGVVVIGFKKDKKYSYLDMYK